ncbi:MAG: FlgD immunoglobulin-like domain containing protein, partial [bacterium]
YIQALYNGSYHRGASPWVTGHAIKFSSDYQTGIAEGRFIEQLSDRLQIRVNRNPARRKMVFSYFLPFAGEVKLDVYDRSGRLIRRFSEGEQPRGAYELTWDGKDGYGRDVPEGIYLVRLVTGKGAVTAKTLLVR